MSPDQLHIVDNDLSVPRQTRRWQGMTAATILEPGKVRIEQVPLPQPREGEVLVRLEGCGVCASNVPMWAGRPWISYPLTPGQLGHEGWGHVEALGPNVRGLSVGQRVTLLSDRAYAHFDVAPAEHVVPLPPELDDMPFPGEPLGAAMSILYRSHVGPGDVVAVVGVGFLGAVLTRLISARGAVVLAVSRREHSRKVAMQMGAAETMAMDDPYAVVEQVRQITGGRLCDAVIEAAGFQGPLDLAAELTRERGRLILAGLHQDGTRTVNMQLWNWRGLDVINAHEPDPRARVAGVRSAVDAVARGLLDPSPLYTHNYGLEGLATALTATHERPEKFVKALITMDSDARSVA